MRHGEHQRPLVDRLDRFHGGEELRQRRGVRRVHDCVVDLFHCLRRNGPAGVEQPPFLQDKVTVLPSSDTSHDSARFGCKLAVRRIDQQRVVERVERRVVPVSGHRIELGKIEIVSLAQGATDHWLLLHQGRGGDFARQELSKRGRGDTDGRRPDEQITAGQTPGAVSVEEMTNRDAGIHLDASLCFSTSSRD